MIRIKIMLFDYHAETVNGYPIKIVVTGDGQRKYVNLGIYVKMEHWDAEKLEPKRAHPNYIDTIEELSKIKSTIASTIRLAKIDHLNINQVVQLLTNEDPQQAPFFVYAARHIKGLIDNGQNKTASIKQNAIKSFQLFVGNDNLQFKEIDSSLLKGYANYNIRAGKMSPNGIHNYFRSLRSIYNEAMNSTAPFRGVMPKLTKTANKNFTIAEMRKTMTMCVANINLKVYSFSAQQNFIDYFCLCFLLGGIDIIDLANLNYKQHVKSNRVVFQRFKGNTDEWINNGIHPLTQRILDKYSGGDYLVPIHKASNYEDFRRNYTRRIRKVLEDAGVQSTIGAKSPRYTFINIAKEIGVPRSITEEIVGHSRNDTHSIYESDHTDKVKDLHHFNVIDEVLKSKEADSNK